MLKAISPSGYVPSDGFSLNSCHMQKCKWKTLKMSLVEPEEALRKGKVASKMLSTEADRNCLRDRFAASSFFFKKKHLSHKYNIALVFNPSSQWYYIIGTPGSIIFITYTFFKINTRSPVLKTTTSSPQETL